MKKLSFYLGSLLLPCLLTATNKPTKAVLTTLTPQSQGNQRSGHAAGLYDKTYLLDAGPFYGTASVTASYAHTFRSENIAESFFGPALVCSKSSNPYIKIQGSEYQGTTRDSKALFADNFYLPSNYSGRISFEPRIKNIAAHFDAYLGLNNVYEGFYVRVSSPLVHTRWNLGMCEKVVQEGTIPHEPGYFTPNYLPTSTLLSRFTQYAQGQAPNDGLVTQNTGDIYTGDILVNDTGNVEFNVLLDALRYAQLPTRTQTKTGLGDIRVEWGKIITEHETYSIGAHLTTVIPTGTKKKGLTLFEPVIGNGHHWTFGGGFNGDYQLYTNNIDTYAALYGDFNVSHVFKAHQKRTFDIKNKPLSRYMLVSRFTPAVNNLQVELANNNVGTSVSAQFANHYAPLANISTLDVLVSAALELDGSLAIHYHKNNWDFDCGYKLWYRSKEKISCLVDDACCNEGTNLLDPSEKNRWALKGDARMYGFRDNGDDAVTAIVPLSATESQATIFQGTNQVAIRCDDANNNATIDNAQPTLDNQGTRIDACAYAGNATVRTSYQPIFVQKNDLDITGSQSMSHTLFAHTNYTGEWHDYKPYIGFGASVELGTTDTNNNHNTAISQWTVWLKTGIAFD